MPAYKVSITQGAERDIEGKTVIVARVIHSARLLELDER